jgi:MFS family permease
MVIVVIIDGYSTALSGLTAEQMLNEFFPLFTDDQQNRMLQLGNAIVNIGILVVFFMQYIADKIGRKKAQAITAMGMGLAALGMFISPNYIIYVLFWFLLSFFTTSDLHMIYINEEAKAKRRATTTNIVLIAGLSSGFLMFLSRRIFIPTEISPFWRGMFLFPIIAGITIGIVILFTLKETSIYEMAKEKIKARKRNLRQDIKSVFNIEEKKSYKAILLANFLYSLSIAGYISLKIKYLDDKFSPEAVSLVILVNTFAVFFSFFLNLLSDRVGRKKIAYIWAILLPVSVVMLVIGGESGSFGLALLGNTFNGIGFYGFTGLFKLMAIETVPNDRRGAGTGVRQLVSGGGVILGMFSSVVALIFLPTWTMFLIYGFIVLGALPVIALKVKEMKGVDLSLIK